MSKITRYDVAYKHVLVYRFYDLSPIAVEDYSGTDQHSFYAVAVARKTDAQLTIFNLKRKFRTNVIFTLFIYLS
jgi:hypothetical protein